MKDLTVTFTHKTYVEFVRYLAFHELDIANGINDFDALKGAFTEIFSEEPKQTAVK